MTSVTPSIEDFLLATIPFSAQKYQSFSLFPNAEQDLVEDGHHIAY